VNRREFLVSGAVTASYAVAARPVFANAIQTPGDGLATGRVQIPVAGGEMAAVFAVPEGVSAPPLALVVHEIFGLHEYIDDVVRRLAREGYFAIAPDLYQRQGDVSSLTDIDSIIKGVVMKVPDAQVMADLDAARAWAGKEHGANISRTVITGFCWGGRIVWLYAAHAPDILAGAAWYGRLKGDERPETPTHPIDVAAARHAPVLGLYGTEDRGIPLESVEEMRSRVGGTDSESEIILFPGAPHGFHADYRPSYRGMAASEGWRRMLGWFKQYGTAATPIN
jgi:carboxymethylenebutenolidase